MTCREIAWCVVARRSGPDAYDYVIVMDAPECNARELQGTAQRRRKGEGLAETESVLGNIAPLNVTFAGVSVTTARWGTLHELAVTNKGQDCRRGTGKGRGIASYSLF